MFNSEELENMKTLKLIFLSVFLVMPMAAFAHGEEVLTTIFLEFIVFIILVVGLLIIDFSRKGKLIICVLYILVATLAFLSMNNLPYNQYQTMINIVIVVAPLSTFAIGYIGLKNRLKKR